VLHDGRLCHEMMSVRLDRIAWSPLPDLTYSAIWTRRFGFITTTSESRGGSRLVDVFECLVGIGLSVLALLSKFDHVFLQVGISREGR
jgi:hypothetical protein